MRLGTVVLGCAFALMLSNCDMGPQSGYGFVLPEGNAANGRQVFIDKHCSSCHAVIGSPSLREGIEPEMTVNIGGPTTKIETYGQLVTSVINPSHKIARSYRRGMFSEDGVSAMRNYNEVLTVAELIDLVAFLQDQYMEFPDY